MVDFVARALAQQALSGSGESGNYDDVKLEFDDNNNLVVTINGKTLKFASIEVIDEPYLTIDNNGTYLSIDNNNTNLTIEGTKQENKSYLTTDNNNTYLRTDNDNTYLIVEENI